MMEALEYHFNVGSNLGDREALLRAACERLEAMGTPVMRSGMVETPAWGFESDHTFLNMEVVVAIARQPLDVLDAVHMIERQLGSASHRDAMGNYADRLVDIDIVAVGDMVIDTPRLKVPHPHLAERYFYLAPLAETSPQWRHPLIGLTPGQMLQRLDNL